MKPVLSLTVLVLVATSASAQKFELKINAGANVTLMPEFKNQIYIVDGFVAPGVVSISNARNPPSITEATSKTRARPGFYAEVEAGKKWGAGWMISLSLGLAQIRYDYDTHISQ